MSEYSDHPSIAVVLLLSAKYTKITESFNALIADAVKALKEKDEKYKDFDKKAQEFAEMERIEQQISEHDNWQEGQKDADGNEIPRPAMPSDEQVKRAEELRNRDDREAFYAAYADLKQAEIDLRMKHAADEVDEPSGLSSAELQGILRCVGTEGTVTLAVAHPLTGKYEWSRRECLEVLAANFC
ncbi:hypothetical protein [uncultured Muribaculum sp.]|uniref:hypothetical protein n=1 Tax=uncultured Muribaculum sp. TaxID=1918613 RepID=UPI0025B0D98E|nr:hypothetical protein [uncultured Muribaculum sp.]